MRVVILELLKSKGLKENNLLNPYGRIIDLFSS